MKLKHTKKIDIKDIKSLVTLISCGRFSAPLVAEMSAGEGAEKVELTIDSSSGFQYPAALMNLGAILHLNGKLQEAEANYLRALDLKPDDSITQSNLRKLWNIMEKQGLRTMSP